MRIASRSLLGASVLLVALALSVGMTPYPSYQEVGVQGDISPPVQGFHDAYSVSVVDNCAFSYDAESDVFMNQNSAVLQVEDLCEPALSKDTPYINTFETSPYKRVSEWQTTSFYMRR